MRKKSLFVISIAVFVSISIAVSSAWAGNVQRNRWEGVAIGVGAAILGKVIWDQYQGSRHPEVIVHHAPRYKPKPHKYHRPRKARGHWEIRKEWVEPVYKRLWNPGHYDRKGRWVPGRWIEIEKEPGYWIKKRVWVADHHHPRYGYRR
jgi:hypothetical protein